MPLYDFSCGTCNGGKKVHTIFRPMSQAGDSYSCPDCGATCERIYSFQRQKEFFEYYDEQYKTTISSGKQEKSLMKQHGHIYAQETPAYEKFKHQRNLAKKKPVYFIGGVKTGRMERD